MLHSDSPWCKRDWKERYIKLYSCHNIKPVTKKEDTTSRISFLSNDSCPYTSLLMRLRENRNESMTSQMSDRASKGSLPSARAAFESKLRQQSDDLGGHDMLLLNMVRARSRELDDEAQDKTLELPRETVSDDDSISSEACVHGLSMRMTERSVSRSRVSRISTRRDMDIPSILAFTANFPTLAPAHLEIPAFRKINEPQQEELPRWSIRRSVCPVCSQKWKDRSSIINVKHSGLKRNSSLELPSITVPARLRTSITLGYVPRPALAAVDEDKAVLHGGLRNTSAAWQLTRARRFRSPKLQMPPPEATAPPSSTAPLARKDLDLRVSRFLTDAQVFKLDKTHE